MQLAREIQTQALQVQQKIALTRSQVSIRQREMRLAQLTRAEISSLPAENPVYEGVGKMYGDHLAPALLRVIRAR